jgi:hypothetical protein
MRAQVPLVVILLTLSASNLAALDAPPALDEQLKAAFEEMSGKGTSKDDKSCLCHTVLTLGVCLNCRFGVVAVWQNPFNGENGTAGGFQITRESGYLWFTDPLNMEVPIKILDGCGSTGTWWVFAAGLTDLGVTFRVHDFLSGIDKDYTNPPGQVFNTILDQQTPWPCP